MWQGSGKPERNVLFSGFGKFCLAHSAWIVLYCKINRTTAPNFLCKKRKIPLLYGRSFLTDSVSFQCLKLFGAGTACYGSVHCLGHHCLDPRVGPQGTTTIQITKIIINPHALHRNLTPNHNTVRVLTLFLKNYWLGVKPHKGDVCYRPFCLYGF